MTPPRDSSMTDPVRVTIFNQTYSLMAADNEAAQVQELAHAVDDLMRSIASKAGNIDSTRTAVLACLHLADRVRSLEQEAATLKGRVESKARQFSLLLDEAIGERG